MKKLLPFLLYCLGVYSALAAPNDVVITQANATTGTSYIQTVTPGTPNAQLQLSPVGKVASVANGIFNVRNFGAVGDGVTDDTAAFQAAINAAQVSSVAGESPFPPGGNFGLAATVYVPPAVKGYVISNLTVIAPIQLVGGGPLTSRLIGKSGATGYMIKFDGFATGAVVGYPSSEILGLQVCNLGFEGNNRQASYGCLYLSAIGKSHVYNLIIEDFTQEAMDFYSSDLESFIDHISIRYCGNGDAGFACINLTDQHAASGQRDAHNMLNFSDICVVFPYGTDVLLDTASGRSFETRDIYFEHSWFHEIVSAGFSEPNLTAPTNGQITHSTFVVNHASSVHLTDVYVPVQGLASPTIYVNDTSLPAAPNVIINGLLTGGRPGVTAPRTGLNINGGYATINSSHLQNCQEGSVVTAAGTLVNIGPDCIFDDAPSFSSNTNVTSNLWGGFTSKFGANFITSNSSSGSYLDIINTAAGGRSYNLESDPTAGGNIPGAGFVFYDVTGSQAVWSANSTNVFKVYGTLLSAGAISVGSNAVAGATNQNLTPPPTVLIETTNATTINWALTNTFTLTLNGNLNIINFQNLVSGQTIVVALTNTVSNYTVTWGNSIKWTGGSQPVQTIGVHTDVWTIVDLSGTLYGSVVQNF